MASFDWKMDVNGKGDQREENATEETREEKDIPHNNQTKQTSKRQSKTQPIDGDGKRSEKEEIREMGKKAKIWDLLIHSLTSAAAVRLTRFFLSLSFSL
jgi:hypothetical protein